MIVTVEAALDLFVVLLWFVASLSLLTLLVRAFWRHRHGGFLLLLIATFCGIVAPVLGLVSVWWTGSSEVSQALRVTAACFLLIACVLGLWGSALLISSYRRLAAAGDKPWRPEEPARRPAGP
jgi:hypothetical protein